jgi:hypothetical protein
VKNSDPQNRVKIMEDEMCGKRIVHKRKAHLAKSNVEKNEEFTSYFVLLPPNS